MATNDVFQLNVCGTLAGREITNTFYYANANEDTLPALTQAQELITGFYNLIWIDKWRPIISTEYEMQCIWAERVNHGGGGLSVQPFINEDGSGAAPSIPIGACALLSLRATVVSANFNRRVYVSGVQQTHVAKSKLTFIGLTVFRELAEGLTVITIPFVTQPTKWFNAVAFSKKLHAAGNPNPFRPLQRHSVTENLRSQRQRNIPN